MRRAAITVAALLLIGAPVTALAQSPSSSEPPSFEMAPGVTVQGLAFVGGSQEPAIVRLRFDPGASVDVEGTSDISLVTIDSGELTVSTNVDLTVYSASDPAAAGRTAPANTDNAIQAGEYFVVPPGAPGHLSNPGSAETIMSIANLPGPGAGASASPGASVAPEGSGTPTGSAAPTSASSPLADGQQVAASEKEFSITFASAPAAGPTTFNVRNDGTTDHEFVIVRTDLAEDQLPQANGEVVEDQLESLGEVEDVAPGTTKSFTVDLTPGHYVVFCNIPGHYPAGMHEDLTVQ
jgi:uncharacterized cupredoxin-like copper-binding protein